MSDAAISTAVSNLDVLDRLQPHQRTCVTLDTTQETQSIAIDSRWLQGMRRSWSAGCSREDLRKGIYWTVGVFLAEEDVDLAAVNRVLTHLKTVLSVTYADFTPIHNTLDELTRRVDKKETQNRALIARLRHSTPPVLDVSDEKPVSGREATWPKRLGANPGAGIDTTVSLDDAMLSDRVPLEQSATLEQSVTVSLEDSTTTTTTAAEAPEPELQTKSPRKRRRRKKTKKKKKRKTKKKRNAAVALAEDGVYAATTLCCTSKCCIL